MVSEIVAQTRWRCPDCGDEMHPKFQRTHLVLCALASAMIAPQVDRLLEKFK